MSKKTKDKKNSKKEIKIDSKDLEEHIIKLIEKQENKESIKKSIDSVVKKEKPEAKKEKKKTKEKGKKSIYGRIGKADKEYHGLRNSGIYSQIEINPFIGFVYKSNIKENNESYNHLINSALSESKADKLGEQNLASHKTMDDYALKVTLNFLTGVSPLFGMGGGVSIEEKEMMKFNLYDRSQNVIYEAKIAIMGFGYNNVTLKTMHAPMHEKKAA